VRNPLERAHDHLAVFVYGTLKRGQVNHELFCRGAVAAEDVFTYGRLFHLPAGYPALTVPPRIVLAAATQDLAADLALQREWAERLARERGAERAGGPEETARVVSGEWMVFSDPETRLPRLDRLEGFRPGRRSLYQRVLIRVWTDAERPPRPAWTYIQPQPLGTLVPGGSWPPT
jgi:gamma-glutamylcyclotransferase (GGCT)/AIG2-like uncharacterized protein YtfP